MISRLCSMHRIQLGLLYCVVVLILVWQSAHPASGQDVSTVRYVRPFRFVSVAEEDPLANANQGDENEEDDDDDDDLLDLDLGELRQTSVAPALDMQVSTVSRTESTVGKSPAAVYVLTDEMIRRSGVRNIADALRLVPGVHVAHINANAWVVSIRGFSNRFVNKILVQIDGRSVYSTTFGGVYWDLQDLILADIQRIEVIRGPGATVWGENAYNGIINILTKSAEQTQGFHFDLGGGSQERHFFSGRLGGGNGDDVHWRIFAKHKQRNNSAAIPLSGFTGDPVHDNGHQNHFGFRMDYTPTDQDRWTVQGDYLTGSTGQFEDPFNLLFSRTGDDQAGRYSAGNLLMRYSHEFSENADMAVQLYADRMNRFGYSGDERITTYDVDFQLRLVVNDRHEVVLGANWRHSESRIFGPSISDLFGLGIANPDLRDALTARYYGFFVQDQITLIPEIWMLWIGSKFGWNTYTDSEIQPTIRMLWNLDERRVLWAAVSRAVRLPNRFDMGFDVDGRSAFLGRPPVPFDQLKAESVLAYEIGYRAQPTDRFSWDVTAFFNQYRDLIEPGPVQTLFAGIDLNRSDGQGWGVELASTLEVSEWWRIQAGYSALILGIQPDPDGFLFTHLAEVDSPRNLFFLHNSWTLQNGLELDLILRYTDKLDRLDPGSFVFFGSGIPSYLQMDLRLGWVLSENLEMAVVGRNLLDRQQYEFGADDIFGAAATAARREIFAHLILKR